ncbi:MAG: hypothetical protein AAF666_15730 [Pseudomonadota bacterium]
MTSAAYVGVPVRGLAGQGDRARDHLHWAIGSFIFSMIIPSEFAFEIADLRISPQRLVLLAAAVGIAVRLLAARDLRAPDWMVIAGSGCAVMASLQHLALGPAFERGSSFVLETAVAYLLPVAFLTTIGQIRSLVRILFLAVAILAVFAAMEAILAEHFIANFSADLVDGEEPFTADQRLGLLRARATFSHQILFGVFCGSLFALFWWEARTASERWVRSAFCGLGVFCSLSSAAFLLVILQAGLIFGERLSRRLRCRTFTLWACAIAGGLSVEVVVQGGLTGFVTRYLSLNPETAYYRQLIWTHITDDITASPLFGTGGFWTRPAWMITSIDQTYFAKAILYGVPCIALLCLSGLWTARSLLKRIPEGVGPGFRQLRYGWLFCILGIAIAGLTVDYFGRALPFVMFILGVGAALDRIAGKASA